MQNNISSLGENWLQTFSEFRINPDLFFDKRKLTREAFCLDILKVSITLNIGIELCVICLFNFIYPVCCILLKCEYVKTFYFLPELVIKSFNL